MAEPLKIAVGEFRLAPDAPDAVRVSLLEHRGEACADLRLFTPIGGPAKALSPTKTGVGIPLRHLAQTIQLLRAAQAEANRRGLKAEGAA